MTDAYSEMGLGLSQAHLSENLGAECVNKAIDGRGRLDIGMAQTISETTCTSETEARRIFNAILSYLSSRVPDPLGIGHSDPALILKALQILDHALHNGSSHFQELVRQQRDTILSRLNMYESTGADSLQDLRREARAIRRLISDDGQQLDFERRHSHTTRWSARINQDAPTITRPSLIPSSLTRGVPNAVDAFGSHFVQPNGWTAPLTPIGADVMGRSNNPRPSNTELRPPLSPPDPALQAHRPSQDDICVRSKTAAHPSNRRCLVRRSSSNEGLRDGRPVKTSYIHEKDISFQHKQQIEPQPYTGEFTKENLILSPVHGDEVAEYVEFVKDQCQNHPGVFLDFVRTIETAQASHTPLQETIPQIDLILVDFPDLRLGLKQILARRSSMKGPGRSSPGRDHPVSPYYTGDHGILEDHYPPLPKSNETWPYNDMPKEYASTGYPVSNVPYPTYVQPPYTEPIPKHHSGSFPVSDFHPYVPYKDYTRYGKGSTTVEDLVVTDDLPQQDRSLSPSPLAVSTQPLLVVNRRRRPKPELEDQDTKLHGRDVSPSPPPGHVNPRLVVRRRRRPRRYHSDEDLKGFGGSFSGEILKSSGPTLAQPGDLAPQSRPDDIASRRKPASYERNRKSPDPLIHEEKTISPPTVQVGCKLYAESKNDGSHSPKQGRRRVVSDLIRDSWMETTFPEEDVVCHISFESNPAARQRRVRKERRWRRLGKLGAGTYGTVWLEESQDLHSSVKLRAVKEIGKGFGGSNEINYNRELEAIAKFSHHNYDHCFVKSLGWYENENAIFITMEYHEKGDLQKYLTKKFPETEARAITCQLLEGLCYMHDNGFAHRDLKPANILVMEASPHWWVKICDFGISKRAQEESTDFRTTAIGTRCYQAPEVCGIYSPNASNDESIGEENEVAYGLSVDLWAVGATAYYLITKQHAFESLSALGKYVTKRQLFPTHQLAQDGASDSCKDLVKQMMAASPVDRPTAAQALNHAWAKEKLTSGSPEVNTLDSPWSTPQSDIDSTASNTWSAHLFE